MIQPNAKCVVNGKKVNKIALWLNQFIALKNKELDVVDANNTPAKRWFLTGAVPGGVGAAESGDRDNLGGTSGGAAGTGGGTSGNRDQINPAPAGGNAGQGGNVNPPVNIDGGGGGGAAGGGGGGGAAGGAGRVRTPAGSATAIGGRRAQPADADIAPETLPSTEPTPAPEPASEPVSEPVSEPAPEPAPEPTPDTTSTDADSKDATLQRKIDEKDEIQQWLENYTGNRLSSEYQAKLEEYRRLFDDIQRLSKL